MSKNTILSILYPLLSHIILTNIYIVINIFLYFFIQPQLDDIEYSIPALHSIPTLENVLIDLDGDSDIYSEIGLQTATPTPSMDEYPRMGTILRHVVLQGVTVQISSAAVTFN